jgi:hypothetical protein
MQKKQEQNDNNMMKGGAIIAGVAALAAAAAGTYFLYGTKEGAKRRKQIKGWTLKMKGEVLEQLENLQDVSQDAYEGIVDKVAQSYKGIKNIDAAEVAGLVADLKAHWNNINKAITAKPRKTTKKSSKK